MKRRDGMEKGSVARGGVQVGDVGRRRILATRDDGPEMGAKKIPEQLVSKRARLNTV